MVFSLTSLLAASFIFRESGHRSEDKLSRSVRKFLGSESNSIARTPGFSRTLFFWFRISYSSFVNKTWSGMVFQFLKSSMLIEPPLRIPMGRRPVSPPKLRITEARLSLHLSGRESCTRRACSDAHCASVSQSTIGTPLCRVALVGLPRNTPRTGDL